MRHERIPQSKRYPGGAEDVYTHGDDVGAVMKLIRLSRGMVAKVDDEDYPKISQSKWYCTSRGHGGVAYAARNQKVGDKRIVVRMHREIIGAAPDEKVDHVNRNGLDNRRDNLRVCTNTQNRHNSKKIRDCTSKYKGVYKRKNRTGSFSWRAQIQVNGKKIMLGTFPTERKAARAYHKAADKHFGQFSRTK